jgi:hypothetical protein
MPFTSYATVADVARTYQIHFRRAAFVTPIAGPLSEAFRSELAFTLGEVPFDVSEYAACETLIYPLLREVWKPYRDALTLWSHQPIAFDEDLCGVPDYLVARRSPLGPLVLDLPYLLVVEAKQDDFPRGWAQCLAALLAAQKLNKLPDQTLYGIATNGRVWEFAQLRADVFTQDVRPFSLQDVDTLAAALHFILAQCRDQATRQPCPA